MGLGNEVKVMDNGLKKYRKLLYKLQYFCSNSKRTMIEWRYNDRTRRHEYMYFTPDRYYRNKQLTDFERGYLVGRHAAFNDVLREIHSMIQTSEYDWIWNIKSREDSR